MTATVARLLEQVLLLPEETREELVERIVENTPPSAEFIASQMSIVRERMENVRQGRSQLVPAEDAHRRVRELLAARP